VCRKAQITVALLNVRHVEILFFYTSSTTDKSMDLLHISVMARDITIELIVSGK